MLKCLPAQVSSFVLAYPYAWASNRSEVIGRPIVMLAGALSFCIVLGMFRFIPLHTYDTTATAWALLVIAHIALGSGVTVWQGTCAAVFSDYYSATPEVCEVIVDECGFSNEKVYAMKQPAFANIKLWSGLGSAIAFFLFPLISRDAMVCVPCCTRLWLPFWPKNFADMGRPSSD
eukprot:scaffold1558_cov403-Prasinococcus_capsulatus_cf.AAC.44